MAEFIAGVGIGVLTWATIMFVAQMGRVVRVVKVRFDTIEECACVAEKIDAQVLTKLGHPWEASLTAAAIRALKDKP